MNSISSGIVGETITQCNAISQAFAAIGVSTIGQTGAQVQAACIAWSAGKTQTQINLALFNLVMAAITFAADSP